MKQTIWCTLFCLGCGILQAQTPQYIFTSWSGTGGSNAWAFSASENKVQSLYYPTDFPGMPRGNVTNIYLRAYPPGPPTLDNITYHNVQVSIGYTADSGYSVSSGSYTFAVGLTPIINTPAFLFKGVKTIGNWIKFSAGSKWIFDPAKNFVIEVSHSGEIGNNFGGFNWMASNSFSSKIRSLGGAKEALWTVNNSNIFLDLGFDITPAGVDDYSNIRNFGLFPNPSTDGRFIVSAESRLPIRLATVAVSNSIGQVIYRAQYQQPGTSLFKKVPLPKLPTGIYFVEVIADGERIIRRLCLQQQ